ncbi:hypothetical protein Aduo_017826 [Ancylostoma duodenale]
MSSFQDFFLIDAICSFISCFLLSRCARLRRLSAVFFQILSALLWSRVNQGMRLLLLVLVGCVAATNSSSSKNKRAIDDSTHSIKRSEIVEGSGDDSGVKHSVSSPDVEIHGSGYGSDDEDGDSIHGSGGLPEQNEVTGNSRINLIVSASIVDVVEGSGKVIPSVQHRPQVTTTTTTTHMPPVHSSSDSDQSHVFNPVVPIRQLPKDDVTTTSSTTTTTTSSTRRVAIQPATTPDPTATQSPFHPVLKPGIFAAVVGGTVVGLLTAILLVMFIVYRMRKKDEGSYALEEPKPRPYASYAYTKASTKEFYA